MRKFHVMFWVACGIISAGFLNKSLDDDSYHWSTKNKCEEWAHKDQAFSVMISAGGPVTLFVAMAFTGFGYKGWSLSLHECDKY